MDLKNGEKKLVFINKEHDKFDEYDCFEHLEKESFLRVNHRNNGINESYLYSSMHWHDFYELEFVYDGEGRHLFGKTDCVMNKGFVCFRTPTTLHSTIQNTQNKLKLYNLQFTSDYFSKIIDTFLMVPDKSFCVFYNQEELEEAIAIIEKIILETKMNDKYSFSLIKAEFTKLFVTFIRKLNLKKSEQSGKNNVIVQVAEYIHNNFRDDITLKQMAEIFFLTPNYLGELFKKETGKTCSEYTNDLRFSLAEQLILNTNNSINEISYECGFNSIAYFIKKFKNKYGCSPVTFRKQHQILSNNMQDGFVIKSIEKNIKL